MIVSLTASEIKLALEVFGQRCAMNIDVGAKHKYGSEQNTHNEALDIIGTRGELAVAKCLNLYWSGSVGNYKAIDVGGLIEVRAVDDPSKRLMIHEEDKDTPPFVLAVQIKPTLWRLVGWMYGWEAKNPKYWSDPSGKNRPAFFVETADLHPMSDLVKLYGFHASEEPEPEVSQDEFL